MKILKQLFFGFLLIMMSTVNVKSQVTTGVFADCQYCSCDPAINRYYGNSLKKIDECITRFNSDKNIEFVVGLGDLIDRDFTSFDQVNEVLKASKNRIYHTTGNHDFEVDSLYFDLVPEKLGLKQTYYTVQKKDWQFIFLDGNEITLNSNNQEVVKKANQWINRLTEENEPNNKTWNAAISEKQQNWLIDQLEIATSKKRNVALFCHYPLLPLEAHALWNSKEILAIIEKFSCVKAWINGHNHAGNYAFQNGIHFINLKGMVETENENAYSIITFTDKKIEIEGFGREANKSLPID